MLPGVLTEETCARTIAALARIDELQAEYDSTAEGQRKIEIHSLLQQQDLTGAERQDLNDELNSWDDDGGHGMRMGIKQIVAEHDEYLESVVGHPQMLALAKSVLGDPIRFDHQCDSSGRQPGNAGMGYHSHAYATDQPHVGYIRIFWYVNGFKLMDGNLKTVSRSFPPCFRRLRSPVVYCGRCRCRARICSETTPAVAGRMKTSKLGRMANTTQ